MDGERALTHLDLLALGVGLVPGPLALVAGGGRAAGDVALGHAQVQQQRADLALELHAAGVPQHRHQVQLQVLTHAAHLRLGQGRRQVGWGAAGRGKRRFTALGSVNNTLIL